ncbi:MAG: YihA family ribosome biogenesis GTP-binding protein [Deltaproteobacteria bacterium]|nr:YihA family ribosome biogenesis GTP-binding protein [Deltaproteobacteria bacterium]
MKDAFVITSAEFVKAAVRPDHYPGNELPEVAFAGRSNVGKSSLINCLVQRKKLVRTSRTPGRTQTINFFLINTAFHFVDLPGYGFARVPESIRATWRPMVESYLTKRENLKGIAQIMDARHPPTPDDLRLWYWLLDRRIPSIPVLTKIDKLPRSERRRRLSQAAASLGVGEESIVLFSATTGEGRQILLDRLLLWIGIIPPQPSQTEQEFRELS